MSCGGVANSPVVVSFRTAEAPGEVTMEWGSVGSGELAAADPWRTFRWHLGQRHYSGTYWSSTISGPVIYESRLELARLLFGDFDSAVRGIVAQPFLLRATVDRRLRRHVPDYFLMTDEGPLVIDVKPASRLSNPKVAFTLDWTREVVEARGWRYEVATEPAKAELENVRFLAGYRRGWLFDAGLLEQLRACDLHGATLGDALRSLSAEPSACV